MQKLRSQINESFFNPALHFLPLILFIVMEDFYDTRTAWLMALPVSLALLVYIYFIYKKLFEWFVGSTLIFTIIATVIGLFSTITVPPHISYIESESAVLILFAVSLFFRHKIEKFIEERSSKRVSMINNLNELFRMMWILGVVIFFYVHAYVLLIIFVKSNSSAYIELIRSVYVSVLIFIFIYEIIRVTIVRIRLLREEWWPIVNEKGNIIGHIQHALSLSENKKYMHPIVRVMVLDGNKILLQKRKSDMTVYPGMWDTAVSNHIKMGETVELCVSRTIRERYNLRELKTVLISNYTHEAPSEFHYAFLFVACNFYDYQIDTKFVDQVKWWTLQQIEDNADCGIFTSNFLLELDIIKRSGLLSKGICDCECRLKDAVAEINKTQISS